jgi:hypothetical protein
MSWEQSLDRWLTTPPEDPFSDFVDAVIDCVRTGYFEAHEDWFIDPQGEFNSLMQHVFFNDGIAVPAHAALIAEGWLAHKHYAEHDSMTLPVVKQD